MKKFSKFVGMDVHKATIAVFVADANGGEVRYVGEIANTPEAIEKLVREGLHKSCRIGLPNKRSTATIVQ